ncbi:MAG: 16S rRNA (cytosine(1402)-N(4))-methyltransferase RsmH [Firmicutes bacterium]|nr:16S rRNA (cytosine(1402)-N(4))-methyltransferase RsmH [Bacillota bacterium]
MDNKHISVLLNECIENLNLKDDSVIVDCTLGYAGHSSEILKRINKGFLFAFDQDNEAILSSTERLNKIGNNYEIIKSNFVNIASELNKRNISKVDGILYDLGVSSPQLDEGIRGFSFHQDARLDMRMNQDNDLDAFKVVNTYSYEDLVNIFYKYGEEKYASSIARGIINSRPINTTLELVEIIKNNVPEKYKREKHPARKVFQAIRIEVNDELNVFEKSLKDALELLNVGGRICVITFHSLEDKICKNIFNSVSKVDDNLKHLPVIPKEYLPKFKVIKTIEPGKNELDENSRARSAKLRIIERIG